MILTNTILRTKLQCTRKSTLERSVKTAKQFILYNLADHVTDEEYKEYVTNEKGPLLDSLSSVKKFELVRVPIDTQVLCI